MDDEKRGGHGAGRPDADRGPAGPAVTGRNGDAPDVRDPRRRIEDHEAIARLADELLPSLIARLGATGLGEIEVREGSWRLRLRRPLGAGDGAGRRASDRASRSQPGHGGHGHAPAALEIHRPGIGTRSPGSGGTADAGTGTSADALRATATSPAVGVFQPRPEMKAGTRVRAGDRLAIVDVLGVPQEVVAPVDGLVGASLVEPGQAVEYGQELIRIELPSPRPPADAGDLAAPPGDVPPRPGDVPARPGGSA